MLPINPSLLRLDPVWRNSSPVIDIGSGRVHPLDIHYKVLNSYRMSLQHMADAIEEYATEDQLKDPLFPKILGMNPLKPLADISAYTSVEGLVSILYIYKGMEFLHASILGASMPKMSDLSPEVRALPRLHAAIQHYMNSNPTAFDVKYVMPESGIRMSQDCVKGVDIPTSIRGTRRSVTAFYRQNARLYEPLVMSVTESSKRQAQICGYEDSVHLKSSTAVLHSDEVYKYIYSGNTSNRNPRYRVSIKHPLAKFPCSTLSSQSIGVPLQSLPADIAAKSNVFHARSILEYARGIPGAMDHTSLILTKSAIKMAGWLAPNTPSDNLSLVISSMIFIKCSLLGMSSGLRAKNREAYSDGSTIPVHGTVTDTLGFDADAGTTDRRSVDITDCIFKSYPSAIQSILMYRNINHLRNAQVNLDISAGAYSHLVKSYTVSQMLGAPLHIGAYSTLKAMIPPTVKFDIASGDLYRVIKSNDGAYIDTIRGNDPVPEKVVYDILGVEADALVLMSEDRSTAITIYDGLLITITYMDRGGAPYRLFLDSLRLYNRNFETPTASKSNLGLYSRLVEGKVFDNVFRNTAGYESGWGNGANGAVNARTLRAINDSISKYVARILAGDPSYDGIRWVNNINSVLISNSKICRASTDSDGVTVYTTDGRVKYRVDVSYDPIDKNFRVVAVVQVPNNSSSRLLDLQLFITIDSVTGSDCLIPRLSSINGVNMKCVP